MLKTTKFPIKTIIQAVLVITAISLILYLIFSVLRPMQQASINLSTQVAELLHPTPTILLDPVTIIHEIQALARLETIQYSIQQVIRAESNQGSFGWLFRQEMLFVAYGTVIAGIDMQNILPEDMRLEDDILFVTLPSTEIFSVALDNKKSYVYDYKKGLLSAIDPNLETNVRQEAEERIRQTAMDDGILNQAMQNAQVFLDRFFRSLGYPQITFMQISPTSTP